MHPGGGTGIIVVVGATSPQKKSLAAVRRFVQHPIMRFPVVRTTVILTLTTAALIAQPADSTKTGEAPDFRAPDGVQRVRARSTGRALSVDVSNRSAVAAFYKKNYVPHDGVPNAWTGSTSSCKVGNNSAAYDAATLQNLRYYRAMAGVPADVSFDEKYNAPARAAALMMEAKNDLSHGPGPNWPCYSAAGKKGAGSSNLCLGCVGPSAIDAYIQDAGVGAVGHRVWALHPRQKVLGSGSSKRAHALYVFGDWRSEEEVAGIESVAWPAAGYMPYRHGYDSGHPWSFQHFGENADHKRATVRLTMNGRNVSVRKETNGHILVWYPTGLPRATHQNDYNRPTKDISIDVKIGNVMVAGKAESFEYTVTFIDPDAAVSDEDSNDDADDADDDTNVTIDPSLNVPLLRSAYDGDGKRAQDLLARGADPNARNNGRWTALMYAAWFGHADVVEALLKAGADPELELDGWNAAGFAKHRGHEKIVRMIATKPKSKALVPATTNSKERSMGPVKP